MKKIDYKAINDEARRKAVSPFRIVKQVLNYREAKEVEVRTGRCCGRCCNRVGKPYIGCGEKCCVVGVSTDDYSSVKSEYLCDEYRKGVYHV